MPTSAAELKKLPWGSFGWFQEATQCLLTLERPETVCQARLVRRRPGRLLLAVPMGAITTDMKEEAMAADFKKLIGPSEELACAIGRFTLVDIGSGYQKVIAFAEDFDTADLNWPDEFCIGQEASDIMFDLEHLLEVCQTWMAEGQWESTSSRRFDAYVTADELPHGCQRSAGKRQGPKQWGCRPRGCGLRQCGRQVGHDSQPPG